MTHTGDIKEKAERAARQSREYAENLARLKKNAKKFRTDLARKMARQTFIQL